MMNKKPLLIAFLLVSILLVPAAAFAEDHALTDGVFDLRGCASGDTVTVAPGAAVTLTGTAPGNVAVSCGAGVTLTLFNVSIDNSAVENSCALRFTGAGNSLILSGASTLKSGSDQAGIQIEPEAQLQISGDGVAYVYGGTNGAGIGGGYRQSSGDIAISGGTITATGGYQAAGIGGGYMGSGTVSISGGTVNAIGGRGGTGIGGGYQGGGAVSISGGTVNATGGLDGAGIGGSISISGGEITAQGGSNGAGVGGISVDISDGTVTALGGYGGAGIGGEPYAYCREINISGGFVNALGGFMAAGIGGGYETYCNEINISGGTIAAIGGKRAAGIGGGYMEYGGNITISGGIVYAQRGRDLDNQSYDIGSGTSSHARVTISDTAAVFLRNDRCFSPLLSDGYEHQTILSATDPMIFTDAKVYGITVPVGPYPAPDWTGALGGYFRLMTVTYEPNGGIGTPPSPPPVQHIGTAVTASNSSRLIKTGFTTDGWNTQADGGGVYYASGEPVVLTPGLTLYAYWSALPDSSDPNESGTSNTLLFVLLGVLVVAAAVFVILKMRHGKQR